MFLTEWFALKHSLFHSSVATLKYHSFICVDSFICVSTNTFSVDFALVSPVSIFYGTYCWCNQSCLIFWSIIHSHSTLSSTFSIQPFKWQVSAAAEAQFNLNSHCRTMFSLPDEKDVVHIMGQRCPIHPFKVNFMKLHVVFLFFDCC